MEGLSIPAGQKITLKPVKLIAVAYMSLPAMRCLNIIPNSYCTTPFGVCQIKLVRGICISFAG